MPEKPTILIVDDAPENLSVLSGRLLPEYGVRVAISGARAPQIAASAPIPDLILLDVMMPGLDGYAVIKHLKADPTTRDIPVVFVTALIGNEDEDRGLALAAVDYTSKPIRPAIVLARARSHLELRQVSSSDRHTTASATGTSGSMPRWRVAAVVSAIRSSSPPARASAERMHRTTSLSSIPRASPCSATRAPTPTGGRSASSRSPCLAGKSYCCLSHKPDVRNPCNSLWAFQCRDRRACDP
jgi:CheY-like chemotaxis protein